MSVTPGKPRRGEPPEPDSDESIAAAKAKLDSRLADLPVENREVAHLLVDYVEKAQRSEARKLARHNWAAIQSWGKRLMLVVGVFVACMIPVGIYTVGNTGRIDNLTAENRQRIGDIEGARRDSIRLSCEESNRRHQAAVPQIIGLIEHGTPPKDAAERQAQHEAIVALLPRKDGHGHYVPQQQPTTQAGKQALYGITAFVEIIAPAYDCTARLKQFGSAPR